jgi:hypothetical protein
MAPLDPHITEVVELPAPTSAETESVGDAGPSAGSLRNVLTAMGGNNFAFVVFFDLGDTLVIPRCSEDGSLLGLKCSALCSGRSRQAKAHKDERRGAAAWGHLQYGNRDAVQNAFANG